MIGLAACAVEWLLRNKQAIVVTSDNAQMIISKATIRSAIAAAERGVIAHGEFAENQHLAIRKIIPTARRADQEPEICREGIIRERPLRRDFAK